MGLNRFLLGLLTFVMASGQANAQIWDQITEREWSVMPGSQLAEKSLAWSTAEQIEAAANAGNANAAVIAAAIYDSGAGGVVPNVYKKAHYSKLACDAGQARGCNFLGYAHHNGEGVAVDPVRGSELYRTACIAGITMACSNLGRRYMDGKGVRQDAVLAEKFIRSSCDDNFGPACELLGQAAFDLANVYVRQGTYDAMRKAYFLNQEACQRGKAWGCMKVGSAHDPNRFSDWGGGIQRDSSKAWFAYNDACNLGLEAGCEDRDRL